MRSVARGRGEHEEQAPCDSLRKSRRDVKRRSRSGIAERPLAGAAGGCRALTRVFGPQEERRVDARSGHSGRTAAQRHHAGLSVPQRDRRRSRAAHYPRLDIRLSAAECRQGRHILDRLKQHPSDATEIKGAMASARSRPAARVSAPHGGIGFCAYSNPRRRVIRSSKSFPRSDVRRSVRGTPPCAGKIDGCSLPLGQGDCATAALS